MKYFAFIGKDYGVDCFYVVSESMETAIAAIEKTEYPEDFKRHMKNGDYDIKILEPDQVIRQEIA